MPSKRSLSKAAILAGLAVLAAALLIACGGDDEASPTPTAQAGAPVTPTAIAGVPPQGPTAETPGFGDDEPPPATASVNGQSVETGVGTYCWTRMCVDKFGVPTRGTLAVSEGDTVSFAVPVGTPDLRDAASYVFEAVDAMPQEDGSQFWPYPGALGDDMAYSIAGEAVNVTITGLEPGTYVLTVSMYFVQGDVVYGVLIEVQ